MRAFLHLLAFSSLFYPLLSFDCHSVSEEASCGQLYGCTWTASTCTGSFIPSCGLKSCYYIDPSNGSDIQEGSAQSPFKTLTKGLDSLTSQEGSLIIINYVSQLEVEILGYTIIKSSIEIKPLFEKNSYILSLAQFDTSTLLISDSSQTAFSITSGSLSISGLTIDSRSTKTSIQTLFGLGSAQLFFHNVTLRGGGPETINLVKTSSINARFNFNGGVCIHCNWTFQLLEGSHTINKMIFMNLQTSPSVLNVGGTLYINDTILTGGGNAQILFLNMQLNSTVKIQNMKVDSYAGNFIDADSVTQLVLNSSAFLNLDLESSIPFVCLRRFNGNLRDGFQFQNLLFENIKVPNSLFLMEETLAPLFFTNITVNNLFKKPVVEKTLIEIDYEISWPGGIFFLGRNDVALALSNAKFYNIGSHCIGINAGGFSLSRSIFDNSQLDPASAVKPAMDENDDFGGMTWITIIGGTERISPYGFGFIISSNVFNENKIKSSRGGAFRFKGIARLNTPMTNNTFHGLHSFYGGAVYCDNPWHWITSINEFYSSNYAMVGGAIYKITNGMATSLSTVRLSVSGTIFQGNSAFDKGGALYLDEEYLDLRNSNFRNNYAQFGGALCMMAKKISPTDYNLFKNNTFFSNTATKSGGAIKLLFQYQELNPVENDTSIFIDNTDSEKQSISQGKLSTYRFSFYDIITEDTEEDLDLLVSNSSLTKLAASFNVSTEENPFENFTISQKSGHNIDQIIIIEIFDQNNLLADFIDDEKISLDVISTQNSINSFQAYLDSAPQIFTFTKGKIYIKNELTLMGQPTTTATLFFSSIEKSHSFIKGSNLTLNQTLKVFFRNCDIGDIFNSKTKMCETCPRNTYSLTDPYLSESCIACDTENSFCLGGSEIAPKPGYWRYDISTDHFLKCPKSSACLGGYVHENYDPKGKCVFPYEGNLCNQCTEGYAKSTSQSKTCIDCSIDVLYYIKSIGFFLQQVITAFYSVRTNLKAVKEMKKAQSLKDNKLNKEMTEKQIQSNIIRIAINYIQTFSLLLQLKFEWPTLVVNDLLGITTNIAPTNQSGFSFDCSIILIRGTNEHLYFINIVIRLIKPFCMWLLLCFLDFLWNLSRHGFQKGIKRVKKNSMILFLIPSFMYQTSIIQATFELFRCQNFSSAEHPIHFMVENPEVQCWTSSHLFWCLAIGLPNLFLWVLLLPAFLFRMLWKKAKQLHDPQVYAEYSFIYVGLKPEKFFWEFITLLRKVLIVTAFVFLNIISIPIQVFVIFLIIVAFGYLQFIFQPYSNPKMNILEMSSFLILGITTCSSMTLLQGFLNEWFSMTMVIISCILNILFFVAIAFLFVKNYRSKAKKHMETAKTLVRKLTQRVSSLKKTLSGSSLSSAPTKSKSQVYKISPKTTERNLNIEADNEEERIKTNESPPRFSSEILSPTTERALTTYRDEEINEDDELILHNPGSPMTHTRNRSSRVDLINLVSIRKIEESPDE